MKKTNWKKSLTLTASAALALSLLAGCGAQPAEQSSTESKAVGTVLLSVNPEIEVEYDKSGLVLEIEGLNKDGKTVVKDVKNYQGKDCRTVVNELVREIYADGYFEKTVDGHTKNIVLKLEEGSVYVSDEFLQDVADGIRETVQECGIDAKAMTVSEGDLDDAGHIGQNKAKELVLAQLGLESASFRDHEYELDDGDDRDDRDDENEFDLPDDDLDDLEDDDRNDRDDRDDIDDSDDQDDDLDEHGDLDDSDDSDDDNNDVDDRDDLDDRDDTDDDKKSVLSVPASVDDDFDDDDHDDADQNDDLDDNEDDQND